MRSVHIVGYNAVQHSMIVFSHCINMYAYMCVCVSFMPICIHIYLHNIIRQINHNKQYKFKKALVYFRENKYTLQTCSASVRSLQYPPGHTTLSSLCMWIRLDAYAFVSNYD